MPVIIVTYVLLESLNFCCNMYVICNLHWQDGSPSRLGTLVTVTRYNNLFCVLSDISMTRFLWPWNSNSSAAEFFCVCCNKLAIRPRDSVAVEVDTDNIACSLAPSTVFRNCEPL
jgi:hypothetical protein